MAYKWPIEPNIREAVIGHAVDEGSGVLWSR